MEPVPQKPLGKSARLLVGLVLAGVAGLWLLGLHAYFSFPEHIPVHFNLSGQPDRFGERSEFLILPLAFSLVPVLLLLLVRYRFALVNRAPYLVNLPAFYIRLSDLAPEEQSDWLNRYFQLLLLLDALVTGYLLVLEWGIIQSTWRQALPGWFLPVTLLGAVLLIVFLVLRLVALKREMEKAVRASG